MSTPITGTDDQISLSVLEKLDAAVTALYNAQEMLVTATTDLANHKVDLAAHNDIRLKIMEIVTGTGFVTKIELSEILGEEFSSHNLDVTSHEPLLNMISSLQTEIESLKARVTAIEPIDDTGDLTELELALKAVDDYYDPTLEQLLAAWQSAALQNLPQAATIADEYQQLLNAKAEARADVLRTYEFS